MSTAAVLSALLLAALAIPASQGCQTSCGGVDIPYPFGIGPDPACFRTGFELNCSNDGAAPVLAGTSIRVEQLSVDPPVSRVMLPIGYQCFSPQTNTLSGTPGKGKTDLNRSGVYRISNTENMLVVLGCSTIGIMPSMTESLSATGCVSFCSSAASVKNDSCSGVGCCHTDILPGLTENHFNFQPIGRPSSILSYSPCDYAFLVDKGNYSFQSSDLRMPKEQTMPVVLDWAIRDNASIAMSCTDLAKTADYACKSANHQCVNSTNGPGYTCVCSPGYEGNAYVTDGCKDIDECAPGKEALYPCNGRCNNIQGSYDCTCRRGHHSDDAKKQPCTTNFPVAARIAIGITLGLSLLVVAILLTLLILQKRRMKESFKRNGGHILKNVESLQIFTKDEIKKITQNHSEFLGKGGFGKVYKGTLPDATDVAVKSFIEVKEATIDEFTKEVQIQSKMIHKNILKLCGCCLEVNIPMFVYEFAANGSLKDILHEKKTEKLPIDLRLDIAIGSAEGLKYMHLYASHAMRHGDIKPDNILLDGKLVPKISDFGLSQMLKVDEYFTKIVIGCMGYVDPVFIKTGLLTQKSDVYSFGAVLLELITRKENVYDDNCSLIIEFRKVFEREKSGRAMFDKEIEAEEDIFVLEEIGKLALECLEDDVEDRPDMAEVAERLVMLRRNRKHGKSTNRSPHRFEEISMDDCPNNAEEVSGNTSANNSVPATPSPNNKDFYANP